MNTRLSANLSVLGTSLMLILSFSFGFHSYTEAKKTIVTDLNQALQQTILQNSHQESNVLIQSPNLQHFNIFGKIPEPLNQPYAKFTKFR